MIDKYTWYMFGILILGIGVLGVSLWIMERIGLLHKNHQKKG